MPRLFRFSAAAAAAMFLASLLSKTSFAADAPVNDATTASDRAEAVIEKGLNFLKTQQKPEFSWQSSTDPPAISAIVLKAYVQNPNYHPEDKFLDKGYEKLLSYQKPDGSISADLLATYNTAIAISSLAASKDSQYKDQLDKAVAYLRSIQWTDNIEGIPYQNKKVSQSDPNYGGWGYGRHGRADLSNVNFAVDALKDAGMKSDDPAFQAALKFVTRCQNNSETNDQQWAGDDGGFIYTCADGGQSPAGEYTGPDGRNMLRSYGSMSYAGLKSMIYAGLSKDDPRVKAAWKWVVNNWTLDENPGMKANDPKAADSGLYYYYHTLARALRAYGQPVITDAQGHQHDWRVELIDKIAAEQDKDGSFHGTQRWMESKPVLATSFAVLALQQAQADLKEHPAK